MHDVPASAIVGTQSPSAGAQHLARLVARLLERRSAPDHWEGLLASSALSTGTAVLALHLAAENRDDAPGAALRDAGAAGVRWLVAHQNVDGGWGDTTRSRSNISTTAIVWAALSAVAREDAGSEGSLSRAEAWLQQAAGAVTPDALRLAILRRYGKDRTFSVPILTVLALSGKLGTDRGAAWRSIPQLPFELAALPHAWFQHVRLPVVSYALPALIAIGQVRHRFASSRNPFARLLRDQVRQRTLRVLREMQPESGGYLEATPLTSFVVMSLAAAGEGRSAVVDEGVRFLLESMRPDGSWPIDTNLSTWVTTLSVGAVANCRSAMGSGVILDAPAVRDWLLTQQSAREHPFTHAAPGAWAWTPLSGGVPDADDTAGALLALHALGEPDDRTVAAAAAGARWLLGLQNRDGGIPTFCRGWSTLPFDRSTPEITAHALRAWDAWTPLLPGPLRSDVSRAAARAVRSLDKAQRKDGTWVPLWFGNEAAPDEENPMYGTARVVLALSSGTLPEERIASACRLRAVRWLLDVQNLDGGWGGDRGVPSSVEETGVALSALGKAHAQDDGRTADALIRGTRWLVEATRAERLDASPFGLYFARLWYYEELYPLIFAVDGLASAVQRMPVAVEAGGTDPSPIKS
jgi:squalene-hopene/tetraprenyl-beta-curcumene cyclase